MEALFRTPIKRWTFLIFIPLEFIYFQGKYYISVEFLSVGVSEYEASSRYYIAGTAGSGY